MTLICLYEGPRPYPEPCLQVYMHFNLGKKTIHLWTLCPSRRCFQYHFQSFILCFQKDLWRKGHIESICSDNLVHGLFIIMVLLNFNIFIFPIWKLKKHNNMFANSAKGE